jgi:sugar phosphate isomerase/epimerase
MVLAVQFYTLRDFTKTGDEFRRALDRVREIGYRHVQLSAVGCMSGDSPEVDAHVARRWLDERDLVCCATHRSWKSLEQDTFFEIEFHQALGCTYTAVGSISGDFGVQPESYARFVVASAPVIDRLAHAGIQFGFHNHAVEFAPNRETGKRCYDLLIDEGGPGLQLEVDTYWVVHAGLDPAALLRSVPGRIAAVHLKDKAVDVGRGPVMAPVGEGNLDWDAILAACRDGGTRWLIVEQDDCYRDPFDCLASSFRFLSKKLAESSDYVLPS